jgi:hypothetical protein
MGERRYNLDVKLQEEARDYLLRHRIDYNLNRIDRQRDLSEQRRWAGRLDRSRQQPGFYSAARSGKDDFHHHDWFGDWICSAHRPGSIVREIIH